MARPRRPQAEHIAVCEAADLLKAQSGAKAMEPIAKAIAARVVRELLAEVDGVNADPFLAALQRATRSPFYTLATCSSIDTHRLFMDLRAAKLIARRGRYLSPGEQLAERSAIVSSIEKALASRYLRHLRQ